MMKRTVAKTIQAVSKNEIYHSIPICDEFNNLNKISIKISPKWK